MKRCLLLLSVLLLAACGASGGLYLPDQAPKHDNPLKNSRKAQTQPQASPAAPAEPAPAAPEPATPPQP